MSCLVNARLTMIILCVLNIHLSNVLGRKVDCLYHCILNLKCSLYVLLQYMPLKSIMHTNLCEINLGHSRENYFHNIKVLSCFPQQYLYSKFLKSCADIQVKLKVKVHSASWKGRETEGFSPPSYFQNSLGRFSKHHSLVDAKSLP